MIEAIIGTTIILIFMACGKTSEEYEKEGGGRRYY